MTNIFLSASLRTQLHLLWWTEIWLPTHPYSNTHRGTYMKKDFTFYEAL